MQKQSSGFASPPPVLGKDTTFSCWSLNQHLLGGGIPSSCAYCLQQTEDLEIQTPPVPTSPQGREVLQCQRLSRHLQCPKLQPTTGRDAAAI